MAEPREITDPDALRTLAHPLRQSILRMLSERGPATSTSLAKALGENTGATSYHLRQLAEHGFIEEAPELAKGRERWWRSPPKDLRFPRRSAQTPEMSALLDEMNQQQFAADLELFARFQAQRDSLGEWGDAVPYSRGSIRVTGEQLMEFFEEYIALMKRFQPSEEDAPPGARRILTRFIAFPAPLPEED
ncbi:helix-turn-helix domain-containing protein [Allokutzneria sp. A3M-2-11 16]|uniref:ArsR/SmtB family transcription factor n=1 Tax=Allokutzneria sp. A3M-2-11 16 TaxID=2962043 RepID=UPI0020B69199|nr:helix-turn-helix domain-containing protein [Allokutzneria sp. A3M-2-11 16]MCP3803747.1 helix-turn-helix domain-containing protein [Allokutzneria sp. A3M-2-11 16]